MLTWALCPRRSRYLTPGSIDYYMLTSVQLINNIIKDYSLTATLPPGLQAAVQSSYIEAYRLIPGMKDILFCGSKQTDSYSIPDGFDCDLWVAGPLFEGEGNQAVEVVPCFQVNRAGQVHQQLKSSGLLEGCLMYNDQINADGQSTSSQQAVVAVLRGDVEHPNFGSSCAKPCLSLAARHTSFVISGTSHHVIDKLRQSPRSTSLPLCEITVYILDSPDIPQVNMSVSSTSTNMLRHALRSARLNTPLAETCGRTIRPAALGASRNVSSAARLPTLTASETRRRPTVRPYQQPVAPSAVNGLSPTSKRTIFIQTENTPNPDVSLLHS